ncbi:Topoisomerase 1-associated factor 1 [Orbilia oligospora]|uniref:Topoisomerase 1-associated factor 1 n=1 Tax=Orbilia oligospora TaxID=2813651 RepID=A0A8H8UWJ7_ORBOL|nr:Topoisomerase 1-associated factor 1 [Orbilia oligospora]
MDITGQPSQKGNADGVDPILRSHIYGLVSALGGPSPDDPNTYILGDDVFGCLRDIKRWLKGYDEKLDRLDVARCLSEANLVVDLMEILSHTSTKGISALNHPNKIGLACAVLRRSQAYYKKNILTHQSGCILKACCVNALPPMTVALSERTPRDEGIIRLVLYLIRNLLQIEELELENDNVWNDISKSSTIESLDGQGIFDFLLSIISGVPELFQQQDVIVVEILFHLLLGVDMRQFVTSPEAGAMKTLDPLAHILKTETPSAGLKAQSRHTRFGTTVVLKNDDGQNKVVTGHSALLAESTGLRKLDDAKKWRKPQHNANKKHNIFGGQTYLDLSARGKLCRFLGQILISGFSSLFQNVRKAIERDSKRILGSTHIAQLFFVGGSLMEFGRGMKQDGAMLGDPVTVRSREFSTLLQPETFIILFRHIREGLESKSWDYVQSGCHYFTQALLVVSEMMHSQDHDEKSLAENILNRLFYEETLHDLMIAVLRSGRKQTVKYLDILTQMIHVYLRCLERYCKSNSGLIVKSKRASKPHSGEIEAFSDSESGSKMPDRKQAEKSFNFQQYETRDTKGSQGYTEVAGFVRFFSKQLVRKLSEYPVLFVEILFQKSQRIGYFLEHGEDRSRCNRELPPLLTIELEEGLDQEKRIAVAVWLVSQDDVCCKQFGWVERVLYCVVEERRGWEIKDSSVHPNQDPGDLRKLCPIAVKFEGDSHTQLHFSSNKLQLLMKVLDFEPEGSHPREFCYVLPDTVSFQTLQESITTFLRYMKSPISEFGDGKALVDCFTMKREKIELKSSDSNGERKKDPGSEAFEPEFPDNLKARKSRSTKGPGVRLAKKMNMDENEAHRRREERKLKERERRRGIKSGLYIGSSDDDSDYERDQEFFEKERVLREAMSKATLHAEGNGQPDVPLARQKRSILDETAREPKRLKTTFNSDGSDSGNDGGNDSSNDIGRDSGTESGNDSGSE